MKAMNKLMKRSNYFFEEIKKCNFCTNPSTENKILGIRLNTSQGLNPKDKCGIAVSIFRCSVCNLIYSNPQPIPVNIQDHYGVPPETYWKEEYFSYDPSYFKAQITTAKKIISFQPEMKALDIGSGLGKCMISLSNAGFDTYGIEPSITFRDKAISKMGIDADRLKLGMLEEVEYDISTFDFITFGAVLEHLYDPAGSIKTALNWLKPGGVIQIEVPSSRWLISKLFNFYFKMRGTNYVTNLSPMHTPYHMFEFDIRSFEKLADQLNFEIIEHHIEVCSIYHIPKLLHPLLKWYMNITNTGMQLTVWLRKTNT